jgi:hypothetical protein
MLIRLIEDTYVFDVLISWGVEVDVATGCNLGPRYYSEFAKPGCAATAAREPDIVPGAVVGSRAQYWTQYW